MVIHVPLERRGEVFLALSPDLMLVYVLRPSGLVGRIASGRVSRNESGGLVVYDAYGRIVEYLSEPGGKVRSWCLLGPTGKPVDGWSRVLDQDRTRVFPFKEYA
jgi:hypothetical protein